jgi:hypothetical protein
MTIDEKLAMFFQDPTVNPHGRDQGVLYLLRREIQDCMLRKVVPEDQVVTEAQKNRHALFATVMVMAAGVDLLAKFYAGNDDTGGVRARLEAFTRNYMFSTAVDPRELADVFYFGLRNPLVHSFCAYNDKFKMGLLSGDPRMQNGAIWKVRSAAKTYAVSVEGLFVSFVAAVQSYRRDLDTDATLRSNFEKMFENYGSIPMLTAFVEPVGSV